MLRAQDAGDAQIQFGEILIGDHVRLSLVFGLLGLAVAMRGVRDGRRFTAAIGLKHGLDMTAVDATGQVFIGLDGMVEQDRSAVLPAQRGDVQERFHAGTELRQDRFQVQGQEPEHIEAGRADLLQAF